MASTYTETPDNYSEIKESVVADIDEIKSVFFKAERCFFMMHVRFKGIRT